MMLEHVMNSTADYLRSMPKEKRKKKGQFFTSKETARYMAEMFDFSSFSNTVNLLDPGAGTGILTAAFVDRAISTGKISTLFITCYENDDEILPILRENLEYMKKTAEIVILYRIIKEHYVVSQADDFDGNFLADREPVKYDAIIGNPPYLKVTKMDCAAQSMPMVVHGAPNLYFLFAAMSLFNLAEGRDMVYIIPRSWTSGKYFKAFRKYFLSKGRLQHIHLFASRDKVFREEKILQETMIIKVRKTKGTTKNVVITSSNNSNDFQDITRLEVPYTSIVNGKQFYVFLPTKESDINTIQKIHTYSQTLPEVGYRMRTGVVVDYRHRDMIRQESGEHTIPLFYSKHIKAGRVNHSAFRKDADWMDDQKPGLTQPNENYVFCKRFTSKEESRRLQCGIYLSRDFPQYKRIGTQNKINFVNRADRKPLDQEEAYGVFALLNSTLFDQYYRILNGSTQVNSTEINSIPVPPEAIIRNIGKRLMEAGGLSTELCNGIVRKEAYFE